MEEAQVLTAAEQRKIAAAERKAAREAEKASKDADKAAKKAADKEARDAAKAAAKAEKDAAKAAAKAEKAEKAPKAPRAIKAGNISYQLTDLISVLVEGNPKRGKSAERFALYKTGMTVQAALEAGVSRTDIVWDAGRGLIYVGEEIVEVDKSAE